MSTRISDLEPLASVDASDIRIYTPPKYIANMRIGSLLIPSTRWPNAFHRLTQRAVLGITWEKRES